MIFVAAIVFVFSMMNGTSDAAENARRQRSGAQHRASIRAMPILERPSRPMHFYGNTVRRNAASGKSRASRSPANMLVPQQARTPVQLKVMPTAGQSQVAIRSGTQEIELVGSVNRLQRTSR